MVTANSTFGHTMDTKSVPLESVACTVFRQRARDIVHHLYSRPAYSMGRIMKADKRESLQVVEGVGSQIDVVAPRYCQLAGASR